MVVFGNFIVEKIIIFDYWIIGIVEKLWNFGINCNFNDIWTSGNFI